jgi:hypothetical protein
MTRQLIPAFTEEGLLYPATSTNCRLGIVIAGAPYGSRNTVRPYAIAPLEGRQGSCLSFGLEEYLAAGYPIGSGVAEVACRHLVKDRMEGTGMRWTVPGAQAMLHLRAVYLNGRWDEFIEYHVETEQDRLYGKAAA